MMNCSTYLCVYLSFARNYFWCKEGWELEDNPVGTAFEIFWMFFEPALFGVTGATIRIDELGEQLDYMAIGVGILVVTGVVRIFSTAFIAFGDNLNTKEKVRTILARNFRLFFRNEKIKFSSFFFRSFVHWHAWQKQQFKRP